MRWVFLEYLCCPICNGDLMLGVKKEVDGDVIFGEFRCESCRRRYVIRNGVPDFVVEDRVSDVDKRWMLSYDKMAKFYDWALMLLSLLPPKPSWFSLERRRWIESLDIKRGDFVLDVATGTGGNLPYIRRKTGPEGKLMAMDISGGMLEAARKKIQKGRIGAELQRANAAYLPYKSNTFNVVVHVGGINTFGEKKRAIDEMVRVAKPDAQIAIVDEGLKPGKEETFSGRFMLKMNQLYAHKPPIELLPPNIKDLQVQWIWGDMFYFISFRK